MDTNPNMEFMKFKYCLEAITSLLILNLLFQPFSLLSKLSSKKFRWSIIRSITTLQDYFCDYMLTYTHKIKGRPKLTDRWQLKWHIRFSFSFYYCILLIKYPKTHGSKSHSRTWKVRALSQVYGEASTENLWSKEQQHTMCKKLWHCAQYASPM